MTEFRSAGKGAGFGQLGEWLDVIHEVNRVAGVLGLDTIFGASLPESGDWWAGGYAEEYADARVIHNTDGTVTVASKTDRGAELIRIAVANKGWKVA